MGRRTRFTWGLAAAIIGVYALLLAGATTAIADAAAACPTWPACRGRWFEVSSPGLVVVWTHRIGAVLVAALVGVLAIAAWRRGHPARVRGAVTVAALTYPVQVVVGARTAVTGTHPALAALHLGGGIVIFTALIAALAWTLEPDTTSNHRDSPRGAPRSRPVESLAGTDVDASVGVRETVGAYIRLMKPRLMWLLSLVAAAGMALAAGPALSVRTVVLTLGGGVLAIGASGTFNHVLERDRDQSMGRTADRPIVQNVIPVGHAVAFGMGLTVASLVVFLQVNVLAAVLGLVAILYYAIVYTVALKPNTVQNTVVGGFSGSLPALIGVAAVTGTVGVTGLMLATVVFLWTPAHFYNLALAYRDDYERGGFPMLPVVRGAAVTRKHILYYLGATLVASVGLVWVTALGPVYAVTVAVLGSVFLWAVVCLHYEQDRNAAFRAFHASNAYLGSLLVAVVVDSLVL